MNDDEREYFKNAYERNAETLYRICLIYLKNQHDAEEAVSDTFIKLMENKPSFEDTFHQKAWLSKVAVNICKNMKKAAWFSKVVHNEEVLMYMQTVEEASIMEEVMSLPPDYRVIIYMYYYEGYKVSEISNMLNMKESTVLSRLARGRKKLKGILIEGGCFNA